MVAWIHSPVYNYCVEYTSDTTHIRSIYLYATSELHVKQILADYRVLTIEKYEGS